MASNKTPMEEAKVSAIVTEVTSHSAIIWPQGISTVTRPSAMYFSMWKGVTDCHKLHDTDSESDSEVEDKGKQEQER